MPPKGHLLIQGPSQRDVQQAAKIRGLLVDPRIDDGMPFSAVCAQPHALLAPARIERLCHHLAGDASLDETALEWEQIDAVMPKAKRDLPSL